MSDTSTPAPTPNWRVISQTPGLVLNKLGQNVPGYHVTAQVVATGSTFSVDIPSSEYTVDNVKAALAAAYTHVAGVDSLTG